MDLKNQSFDVYQRFSAIISLAGSLNLSDKASILDVGGYPGTLADYLKEAIPGAHTITLDRPLCPRELYISGSSEALPFAHSSFDAVLSSDTIEHLTPEQRISSIKEMLRVSKRWLVIGAPFRNPCVEFAEEKINALYRKCFKNPYPWLMEHIERRLPDLSLIRKILEETGARVTVYPNGSIVSWFIMESVQILLDAFPMLSRFRKNLSLSFNTLWAASDDQEPAYRHILFVDKTAASSAMMPSSPSNVTALDEDILARLESLYALADEISEEILSLLSDPAASTGMLTTGYIRQMEEILAFQEKEQKRLQETICLQKQSMENLESSLLFRILRKIGFFRS
jgi:predicted SAM-dependent methyltransferase